MRLEEKIKYAKSITDRKKRAAFVRPLIEKHEKNLGKVGDRVISLKRYYYADRDLRNVQKSLVDWGGPGPDVEKGLETPTKE